PCLLPFATGALVCHYRESLARIRMPAISCAAWLLHGAVWFFVPSWPWDWGLYASLLLSAWMVVSLHQQRGGKLDKMLGDLS
ncbi:hypothetical protein, partial [Enterobacter hormaechei]